MNKRLRNYLSALKQSTNWYAIRINSTYEYGGVETIVLYNFYSLSGDPRSHTAQQETYDTIWRPQILLTKNDGILIVYYFSNNA